MSKARQFIKDCTRSCSNVVYYHNQNFTHGTDYFEGSGIEVQYSPWITPEQALRAVEIERKELTNKAYEWLEKHLMTDYWSQRIASTDHFIEKFKQVMAE